MVDRLPGEGDHPLCGMVSFYFQPLHTSKHSIRYWGPIMHHSLANNYNFVLVLVSFVIALLASYTALSLARKVSTSVGWHQKSWIICSAIVMGIGVWAMHFISMLAFHIPTGVTYNISIVSVSIIVAIGGALVGLLVTFQASSLLLSRLILGGTIMGSAMSAMHYIGMAALQNVIIHYNAVSLTLSIVIAILASVTALYLFFRQNQRISISGLIMGAAITGMHYTGMSAADMTFPTASHLSTNAMTMDFYVMAMYVAFGSMLIFAIIFISSHSEDRRLAEQIALKASILESAIDCILMFKSHGWIIEFNPAAEALFGYTRKEATKLTIFHLLFPFDQNGEDAASLYQLLARKADFILGKRFEITAHRADRSTFPAEIIITDTLYEGKTIYTAYLRDLTEMRQSEELIQKLAYYDHLTGLPNRNKFNELFQAALYLARKQKETVGVMFLDIYRFKLINDSFGHHVGDHVLQEFSALISERLPANSSASRLSGDEFVILFPLGNKDTMLQQAQMIIESLEKPLLMEGRNIYVSTSIGMSIFPHDGEFPEILLKNADQAMYAAKEQGRNCFRFFQPDMKTKFTQSLVIEQSLRQALENNEFSLMYQPKFDSRTGGLVGLEALLHWDSPQLGNVPPEIFIPVAEESRQIIEIGDWVLQTAIKQMKRWHDAGLEPIPIAVNVSAIQFHQDQFVPSIHALLNDLDPAYLEIELTESMELNRSSMLDKLHDLQRIGVRIAIDDFGTGHTSINHLHTYPIHALKIDKSFVGQIAHSLSARSLIESIIILARSLNLDVVAEGVESEEQFTFLRNLACHHVQGYLFAVPVSAEQFESNYVTRLRAAGS
jgi:diguanylate cyclase (GGDEF)-like protein/PAS domain S-box-containing protein